MKKFIESIFIILPLFCLISCSTKPEWEGVFDYYPENPRPGDEITVFYDADSTELSSFDKIDMIAYLYSKELDDAVGVEMKKVLEGWEGKIKTTGSTRGILIKFKHEENTDNNHNTGYRIHLTEGNEPVPGSMAGLGAALLSWGSYYLELDRDFNLALKNMNEDFKRNPEIKDEYIDPYLTAYSELFPESLDSMVNAELRILEEKKELSEENLAVLTEWYEHAGNTEKAGQYKKILSEKFPLNEQIQFARYQEIRNETDINRKKQLADKFYSEFPQSEYSKSVFDNIAIYYRDNKLYNEALDFLKANKEKTSIYRFYSVAQNMFKENADKNAILEITKLGVQRGESELKNPSGKKPEYLTEKEWKEEVEYYAGLNYFAYGKALYLKGEKREAESYLDKAVALTKKMEGEINELYVNSVFETGNNTKAKSTIEDFIKDGKNTESMIGVLKQLYIAEKGSEAGFDDYLSGFKTLALDNIKERLQSHMITEPAPDFILEDLKGNKVSLSSLKGKTVIIDFWATWCGPCISSFPGMKKAVEKYADDENVEFLFINSWERVADKKDNAASFIKKNNYPFRVLMDYDDKVVADYSVSGIPTKFVIDKMGNIRFKSIGFMGNIDQIVDEISVMISLVN